MSHINLLEQQNPEKSIDESIEIKQIIEALLFSSSEPLSLKKIKEIIQTTYPIQTKTLTKIIGEMKQTYEQEKRGWQIDEIAYGFVIRTKESLSPFVEMLHKDRRAEKLSKAAMEVLAIIAYKHSVTRSYIDRIRGVDSSGILHQLLQRDLIVIAGRLEAPGRPVQYGVSKHFLKHFGFKSIEEVSSSFPI